MVQRSRRKPETHLEAERWNTVTPRENPKADYGPKYMVTGCLREWAVVGSRYYKDQLTITEGGFQAASSDPDMRKHSGVVLNEQEGSQQEWYREGEQPVVSCIIA